MKKIILIGLILMIVPFVIADEAWEFHTDNGTFLINTSNLENDKFCKYFTSTGLNCQYNGSTSTLTQEQVEDYVGGMLTGTETGITVTYQDATGDIDFVVSGGSDLTGYFNNITNFTGTLTDTKYCTYDSATETIECDSDAVDLTGYFNHEDNLTDLLDDNYVDITGDTMAGVLNMGSNNIIDVGFMNLVTLNISGSTYFNETSNVFIYDIDDERHHLNVDITNLDRVWSNLFKSQLKVTTFSNTTGYYVNVTTIDGGSITFNVAGENGRISSTELPCILQLTNGSSSDPILNRIYIDDGNATTCGEITVSTSEPVVAHALIARVNVGNLTQITYGTSLSPDNLFGVLKKLLRKERKQGLYYLDGFTPSGTSSTINITTGEYINTVETLTSDNNMTLTDGYFIVYNNGSYFNGDSISDLTEYSSGETFGANKYVIVTVGVVPYDGMSRMMLIVGNKPTSEYGTLSNAEADIYNSFILSPTADFLKNNFLPVAEIIFNTNTDAIQLLSNGLYYKDIRGSVQGGGATASIGITAHNELTNLDYATSGHTGFASDSDITEVNTRVDNLNNYSIADLDLEYHERGEDVIIGGGFGSGGISLYQTGSGFFADDLFIGGDILTVNVQAINGSFLPNITNTYDLGSSSYQWKDGYFDGTLEADTITENGVDISTKYLLDTTDTFTGKLTIDQNGDGIGLEIDSEATTGGSVALDVYTGQGANMARFQTTTDNRVQINDPSNVNGLTHFYRNLDYVTTAGPVVFIEQDNGGDDQPALSIQQDGTGNYITAGTFSVEDGGELNAISLNTGQGDNELYAMDQDVESTDAVTFKNITITEDYGTGATLHTLLEFNNVTISANSTHFCMVGESKICIEN